MTKPRFILIDNALTTMVGHYYEYDIALLANIPTSKYDTLFFSNIDAPGELRDLTIPFFQCGFWAPSQNRRPVVIHDAGPVASSSPAHPVARAPRLGKSWSRSIRARDEQIIGWVRKFDHRFGNYLPVRPLFVAKSLRRWLVRARTAHPPTLVGGTTNQVKLHAEDVALRDIFQADLQQLFQQYAVGPQDVLFFPNMNQSTLAAVIELVTQVGCEQLPHMKMLFRRNVFVGHPTAEQYLSDSYFVRAFASLFDCLMQYRDCDKLEFFTDTDRLKIEYEVFSPFEFKVLPIPFRHEFIRPKLSSSQPFRVIYLGNARREKGFQYLPALVESMRSRVKCGQVEFVFQAMPDQDAMILEALPGLEGRPGVTLIKSPLTDREYYELLNSGDIVLLLYDPVEYYSRSSCIFVESVVSATPFITFDGSWMTQVMVPGTGEVVKDATELPVALERMLDNYPQYQQSISCARETWKDYHNPKRLAEILMGM